MPSFTYANVTARPPARRPAIWLQQHSSSSSAPVLPPWRWRRPGCVIKKLFIRTKAWQHNHSHATAHTCAYLHKCHSTTGKQHCFLVAAAAAHLCRRHGAGHALAVVHAGAIGPRHQQPPRSRQAQQVLLAQLQRLVQRQGVAQGGATRHAAKRAAAAEKAAEEGSRAGVVVRMASKGAQRRTDRSIMRAIRGCCCWRLCWGMWPALLLMLLLLSQSQY